MEGGNPNPSHPKEREMEGGNPNPSRRPGEREMEESNPNPSHHPKEREMEGGNPNRSHPTPSKTTSAGEVQTTDGESPTKLPPGPLASGRSMPSPSPCAARDKNGADGSKSRNKGKAVMDNSSSNNNNNDNGGIGGTGVNGQGEAEGPREQDMFMPIANVIRIMRQNLPIRAKISDDAKQTMQECVSEFISFITGEANERCHEEQRKTITAEDILWSMEKLGFDRYIEPLTLYLQRYREAEGQARGSVHDDSHCPFKRTASDAGLHAQQQPPQYPFMGPQSHYRSPLGPSFISQNPYLQQPHAFLPGGGGSIFTSGEQGPLPPLAPMALYYHGPEAPAYRDMQPPLANREAIVYQEIASGPVPAYGDVPINRDDAGASSSSQAPDPSHQAPFPSFDPYAPNK